MNTIKNTINQKVKKHFTFDIGEIFVLENFMIAEFNNGVDINFENFYDVSMIIHKYFDKNPFGFIANRINSYSINLGDANLFNEAFPNCRAYAVVNYKSISEQVFEIENQFFTFNRKAFKNLNDAINWVEKSMESTF